MFCVYTITSEVDGKRYVGHTVDFARRKAQHVFYLRSGKHHSTHLQSAWGKHGEANFSFAIVEDGLSTIDQAVAAEQRLIDRCRTSNPAFGYNRAPAARSNLGVKYTEASRRKMSAAQKGRTFTDEARAKIAASLAGRKAAASTVQKRVAKITGLKRTREQNEARSRLMLDQTGAEPMTAFGRSQHINDWAREFGLKQNTLRNRVFRSGMTLEEALLAPKRRGHRRDLEVQNGR